MTHRTLIYRALREAGSEGITHADLWQAIQAPCVPHIESLRAEGFEIESREFRGPRGPQWGWALVGERRAAA